MRSFYRGTRGHSLKLYKREFRTNTYKQAQRKVVNSGGAKYSVASKKNFYGKKLNPMKYS